MKIVRDPRFSIKNRTPASPIVRIVLSGFIYIVSFTFLLLVFFVDWDLVELCLALYVNLFIGATALLVFAIISLVRSKRNISVYVSPTAYNWNQKNPYFTTICPTCHAPFDYQLSDLERRNRIVACPCCGNAIRHNRDSSIFTPPYPNN